ncbi:protoporphyrinogen oxidase-like protein [Bacteroides sp. CAG:598]|nr:protoporphyrinogen oxidase-like protein [Bacteroides sp. CAG:598]
MMEDIIAHSGTEKLRVYPALFELDHYTEIFYRLGYYDNIMGADRMSLYVEIGFPENFELSKEGLYLERVLQDLRKMGVVTTQELLDYEAVLMKPAYAHISKNSIDAVERLKKELSKKDIYSIGRYGSWTYCSIEDNILEAKSLVENLQ